MECDGNYGWGAGLRGATVAHNTIVGARTSVFIQEPDPTNGSHTGNVFAGNAFLTPTLGQAYIPGGLAGLDFHENAWFEGTTDASGEGDVTSDPLLPDIGSTSPFDLEPGASSPLVDAVTSALLAPHDLKAQERAQGAGADMGAFELSDADATVVTVPLPENVTDPIRVFTAWDWGDGSEVLTTVGVTSSHHFAPGSYEVTATVHDPEAGTYTATTTTVEIPGAPPDGGAGAAGGAGGTGGAGGAAGSGDESDADGCGCRLGAGHGLSGARAALLGALLLTARRRRRSAA